MRPPAALVFLGSALCLTLVAIENAKTTGTRAFGGDGKPLSLQASAQQLAHRSRTARHALVEAPVLDGAEFIRAQHDLQPFAAFQIRHGALPIALKMSK
ncbi:exported hypothetical protein [Bosea sp. 125]|nr:exported hypothetical protein [Bosea sp. 125]